MPEEIKYLTDECGGEYIQQDSSLRIYRHTYGGALKGFFFHYPQIVADLADIGKDSDEDKAKREELSAVALSEAAKRYGNEKVLDLFNTALSSNARTKVLNCRVPGVKDPEETKKLIEALRSTNPELYTIQEAIEFVPGEREKTLGYFLNMCKKYTKEGKHELANSMLLKAAETVARAQQIAAVAAE